MHSKIYMEIKENRKSKSPYVNHLWKGQASANASDGLFGQSSEPMSSSQFQFLL